MISLIITREYYVYTFLISMLEYHINNLIFAKGVSMFDNFINKVIENNWPVYGLDIFSHGHIVCKYDFSSEERHPIYSATKSFTATAAGIAAAEGKFKLEASVYDYLREEISSNISEEQLHTLQRISMKRLLTMSVPGYPFRPEGENWLDFCLTYPIPYSEIPAFEYSNIPAYLVGVTVEKAVGEHLISYLGPRLLEPLGIENLEYLNCPSGHFYGASGMSLTVNELSRLGQLYLQMGQYNNRQLLLESWVREATSIQQMNREGGYGYYFWKYKDGFSINGKWGQKCFVFPAKQLMITYLANFKEQPDTVRLAMEQDILPQFGIY